MRKSIHALSQTELINALKINDSYILKQFYTLHYKKIEALVLKNSGITEYTKDVYQGAFLTVLPQTAKADKFVPKKRNRFTRLFIQYCKKQMDRCFTTEKL
ncbi:hypothetical protein LG651_14870 [Tamlana sp. 62-3]|uniref:Uncharacterized protein n=1 Tax=Neotamlana sargassicola TaxID=2883125 RepID=A0A9X1IBF2_9FLAO|nr:hypothetical protein [Tamlana sargassicola]